MHDDNKFPSETIEGHGHFVGISENVGNAMIFKILTSDTNKIIHRSVVRSAEGNDRNYRAEMGRKTMLEQREDTGKSLLSKERLNDSSVYDRNITALDSEDGKTSAIKKRSLGDNYDESRQPSKVVTSRHDYTEDDTPLPPMPITNPEDLVGRTFLMEEQEDGQKFRARIVEAINSHEDEVMKNPELLKFKCSINNDQYEEVMAYNDIVQRIYAEKESDILWKYKEIVSHEGPLSQNHPNYKGFRFNVRRESDEITSEPLKAIAADDPVTVAQYALDNDLLNTDGWRRFQSIAKNQKKMKRMINQAKLRSYRHAPKYMFGFEIPRNYNHALELDKRNRNTRWQDCTKLELSQLNDYSVFEDRGKGTAIPQGYKKIRTHLVYAVKHDGRHKAQMVADGHLTDVPLESVYSGVVSL